MNYFIACTLFFSIPFFLHGQDSNQNTKKKSKTVFDNLEIEMERSEVIPLKSETNSSEIIAVNVQDSLALVDLYNSTNGPNWTNNSNWLTDTKLNYWYGIRVENNRVVDVNLVFIGLSGTIPSSIGNLTALKRLVLNGDISGSIPPELGSLKSLTDLSISGGLTGNIPSEIGNLSSLERLYLGGNNLTGSIPSEIGKLTKLVDLDLRSNKLSGSVPEQIGNLNALVVLNLTNNNITGIPPAIGNLSSLTDLNLNDNSITGQIPTELGNMGSLKYLMLYNNNITGNIPTEIGNSLNLVNLSIYNNNLTGRIPKEIGNIASLKYLLLDKNDLTGSIPPEIGNLSNLSRLSLSDNDLSGKIPKEIGNLTSLTDLYLSNNNFSGSIPTEFTNLLKLKRFQIMGNQFVFGDMEFLVPMNISTFTYGYQDTVFLKRISPDVNTELLMDVGGSQTSYQWFYRSNKVEGATSKTFMVPSDKDLFDYYCKAQNSLLPQLTLIGAYYGDGRSCWKTGQLEFCLSKGKWKKAGGKNRIGATDIISINNFLFFDGNMTIDTVLLQVDASGEFYVKDIPLTGGSIGKYTLSKGSYNLKLLGTNGKITNFLNSALTDDAVLFGSKLKIDNLQLANKNDTVVVKVGCTISIPGISGSCGGQNEVDTDVKLTDLQITSAGITLGGIAVKELGIKDGYCLKELDVSYDSKKDIFKAKTMLDLPFGKIGGGLKLEEGLIDSIGWRIEAAAAPFVLGTTTIGIKGFFGHISNITYPKIETELGGIFSDITSDDLYLIEASGKTIWPSYFEVKGAGQFLRPVLDGLPFQLKGDVSMSYNIPNEILKLDFNGNFGTLDEKTWLITGKGDFKICHRYKPAKLSGGFEGNLALPKLANTWPYDWLNSMFDFPVNMKTKNKFIWGDNQHIKGIASFKSNNYGPYALDYLIDLSKKPDDEDYFYFTLNIEKTKSAIIHQKSGGAETSLNTFEVPQNTDFAVFEINSQNNAPASTLKNPEGKEFIASSETDNVLYTESTDKKSAYWSVISPKEGNWTISLNNPAEQDTIITYFKRQQQDFKFSLNQSGNLIEINWDAANIEQEKTVRIMLDDDSENYDGFLVAEGDATTGSLSFTLDENYTDCKYYLFAELLDDFSIVQSYADETIENPLATLAPPENLSTQLNPESGELDFTWQPSQSPEIKGYILTVTDELGNDSVYAVLNSLQTGISLFIEDYESKTAKIESYNEDWKIGCPTILSSLVTGFENIELEAEPDNMIHVYPNPTNSNLTIRYTVSENSRCEIRIFDIYGREVARPLSEFKSAGIHQLHFEYNDLPNGIYLIRYLNEHDSYTIRSILSK